MPVFGPSGLTHEKQVGTSGVDLLKGTDKNGFLIGLAGRDLLLGDSGKDILQGGPGIDRLKGGNGNDSVVGGSGNDVLDGDKGNDHLAGGAGNDLLRAADRQVDDVRCGPGDDVAIVDVLDRVFDCETVQKPPSLAGPVRSGSSSAASSEILPTPGRHLSDNGVIGHDDLVIVGPSSQNAPIGPGDLVQIRP